MHEDPITVTATNVDADATEDDEEEVANTALLEGCLIPKQSSPRTYQQQQQRPSTSIRIMSMGMSLFLFLTITALVGLRLSSYYSSYSMDRYVPHRHRQLQLSQKQTLYDDTSESKKTYQKNRILYIVTSIAEYDNGRRSTTSGNDRFTQTLLPILLESVQSLLSSSSSPSSSSLDDFPFINSVDVFLITHYPITPARYQQVRTALPKSVGLQIWDQATPYGYITDIPWDQQVETLQRIPQQLQQQQQQRIQSHTRGLSRQHRYVIKDKLLHYDTFINVEDDMLIHKEQVQHFVQMTNTIYFWRTTTQKQHPRDRPKDDPTTQFYGSMTEHQLGRTIPGFVRVEVVLSNHNHDNNNETEQHTGINDPNLPRLLQTPKPANPLLEYFQQHPIRSTTNTKNGALRSLYHNIPRDYEWETSSSTSLPINASICCQVTQHTWQQQQHSSSSSSSTPPPRPTANDLYFWEMSLESLGVRQMPQGMNMPQRIMESSSSPDISNAILKDLDWVMLLGGSNNELFIKYDPSYIIGDYWSGQYLMDTTTTSAQSSSSSSSKLIQRPDRKNGKHVTNQGGWLGTRRQIVEWHTRWCRGSFLPYVYRLLFLVVAIAHEISSLIILFWFVLYNFCYQCKITFTHTRPYDLPNYRLDGLDGRTVEYWSGGIQLVGINACNLQRIIALRPEYFSKHLLYHTSNNKQKSNTVQYRFSQRPINEFWGQINTVRKHAERTMKQELGLL